MKVDINYIAPNAQTTRQTSQAGGNRPECSFGEVLARQVDQTQTASVQTCSTTTETTATTDAAAAPALLSDVNGLLDTLDRYSRALGDSRRTLKDIAPLAAELDQKAQQLEGSLSQNEDPRFTGLAQEVLTQARVEAIKFQRGDYI